MGKHLCRKGSGSPDGHQDVQDPAESASVAMKAGDNFKLSSKVWLFLEVLGLLRPLFSCSQRLLLISGLTRYI